MPRKTRGTWNTPCACFGFNEAAARCRGKLTWAREARDRFALLQ